MKITSSVFLRYLPLAGWPLAALMAWLWIGSMTKTAEVREQCNTRFAELRAQAELEKSAALLEAAQSHQRIQDRLLLSAAELSRQLEKARNNVRTEVRTVREVIHGEPENCANQPVDARLRVLYD